MTAIAQIPCERFELTCGATLLVSHRPLAPVCAAHAHLRGGHSLDPAGKGGTAYLSGRLVDQGTALHTEAELAALLENAGGSLAGGSTGLGGAMPNMSWELLVELLCECLTVPSYPDAEVARERKRLVDRLIVDAEEPRVQGGLRFRRLVYGQHWLGRPEVGEPESVPRIERQDLVEFHRSNWVGRRLLIAFCGDVLPERVRDRFESLLAGFPAGEALPPPDRNFPLREVRTDSFAADRQQVHLYLGHLGVTRTDPDYPALMVMDHVLGSGPGFTSRITRKLRDEQGLAYTVHADIHASAGVLPGMFIAYIGTSPQHMKTAIDGFLHEIRLLRAELPSVEELALARSYLTGSFALGYERAARRVQSLILAERCGLPADHLKELYEAIASVTREDVRRVARDHLDPDHPCLVAAGAVGDTDLGGLIGHPPDSILEPSRPN